MGVYFRERSDVGEGWWGRWGRSYGEGLYCLVGVLVGATRDLRTLTRAPEFTEGEDDQSSPAEVLPWGVCYWTCVVRRRIRTETEE